MWGTPMDKAGITMDRRFIPTHVGNTYPRLLRGFPCPVHPHACGEHEAAEARLEIAAGSSPRMWGTLLVSAQGRWVVRFIPTHVGNTRMSFRPRTPSSVHPHACGEHSVPSYSAVPFGGSSPRMWGTLNWVKFERSDMRFIPTHVGNTTPG